MRILAVSYLIVEKMYCMLVQLERQGFQERDVVGHDLNNKMYMIYTDTFV